MRLYTFCFSFLLLHSTLCAGRYASAQITGSGGQHLNQKKPLYRDDGITKLFVFGDSYGDTGNIPKGDTDNIPKGVGDSWKPPYGITFPGYPTGRFSDGLILPDFVAKFYGLKSPVPYRVVKLKSIESSYGVSFAYGGTGVLDTLVLRPNMTTQIDFFENLFNHLSVYTKNDLETSLFLLSVGGNDYNTYSHNGGTDEGLPAFAQSIVNQIVVNLKRLHGLGSRKIMVTSLPPGGCLPKSTLIFQFQKCNDTYNRNLNIHNTLLSEAVVKLNNDYKDSSFIILDLFSSFKTLLFNKWFETPLKPCCMGIRDGYSCGSVEINIGERMYTECEDKETAFFWDDVHPTQAGWSAVFNLLSYTLQLFH